MPAETLEAKPLPEIVIDVPPAVGPEVGETLDTDGV